MALEWRGVSRGNGMSVSGVAVTALVIDNEKCFKPVYNWHIIILTRKTPRRQK